MEGRRKQFEGRLVANRNELLKLRPKLESDSLWSFQVFGKKKKIERKKERKEKKRPISPESSRVNKIRCLPIVPVGRIRGENGNDDVEMRRYSQNYDLVGGDSEKECTLQCI